MNKEKEEYQEEEEGEISAIDVATKLHAQIKEENDRHEQLVLRQEKLAAQNMLGGKSSAGQKQEPPKEETPEEYKNKVMRGEV